MASEKQGSEAGHLHLLATKSTGLNLLYVSRGDDVGSFPGDDGF